MQQGKGASNRVCFNLWINKGLHLCEAIHRVSWAASVVTERGQSLAEPPVTDGFSRRVRQAHDGPPFLETESERDRETEKETEKEKEKEREKRKRKIQKRKRNEFKLKEHETNSERSCEIAGSKRRLWAVTPLVFRWPMGRTGGEPETFRPRRTDPDLRNGQRRHSGRIQGLFMAGCAGCAS